MSILVMLLPIFLLCMFWFFTGFIMGKDDPLKLPIFIHLKGNQLHIHVHIRVIGHTGFRMCHLLRI